VAQQVVSSDSAGACGACVVSTRLIARLDGVAASLVQGAKDVVVLNRLYYVIDYGQPNNVLIFGESGSFLGVIGRAGSGPGELQSVKSLSVWGDTLFVYDQGNQKELAFSSDRRLLRERRLYVNAMEAVLRTKNATYVNTPVFTADRLGYPIHRIGADGRVTASFGATTPSFDPRKPWLWHRVLVPAAEGGLWVAPRTAFTLEWWTENGQLVRRIVRDAKWFIPDLDRPVGKPDPPPPWITGLRERGRNLVVLVAVPDPNYTKILGPPKPTPHGLLYDVDREDELYDTIIEIIDKTTGSVRVTQRLSQVLTGFLDDSTVVAMRRDPDGVPVIEIRRLVYRGQELGGNDGNSRARTYVGGARHEQRVAIIR
jgi:hypothetical protein